ncbi:C4-dicarboxylate ABC transporter [Sinorhizobium meliloti]|uniref:SLAC1 anion channel family protein n=1 Tax=Rhizobium meliloti TaxID=382 RepID=UPI000FD81BE9|nr:SLAC1 anion channel family protein [Sinorhizobium meliloti]MDE3795793.1 SLAC1 anion channel family protein [Sinorhizobium meliloti]RVK58274.1 C4-dicarboxylate ABC transporter [Sinorhizobium meliloti]
MTIQLINVSDSSALTRRSISQLPINLFASVMGVTGLSLAWREAAKSIGLPSLPGELIGGLGTLIFLALAIGYVSKWARHPSSVSAEFAHPVQSNFFATVAIGLLLQSAFLNRYSPLLSQGVWIVASALTFALAYIVARAFLGRQQSRETTLPPLLIPGVATLDIAVTGYAMPFSWAYEVNMLAFAIGSVMAAVFVALIFARLRHEDPLPVPARPSLMVLVAPFAVGYLAYTNVTGSVDLFATVLFYFGLFLMLVLSPMVFRKHVPFSIAWWAISFPLAALSIAFFRYAEAAQSNILVVLAGLLFVFLAIAIIVVFVRTARVVLTGKLFEVR